MKILKRTESIVAMVLLLIAAAVVATVFVFSNNENVATQSVETPATQDASADGTPDAEEEPGVVPVTRPAEPTDSETEPTEA